MAPRPLLVATLLHGSSALFAFLTRSGAPSGGEASERCNSSLFALRTSVGAPFPGGACGRCAHSRPLQADEAPTPVPEGERADDAVLWDTRPTAAASPRADSFISCKRCRRNSCVALRCASSKSQSSLSLPGAGRAGDNLKLKMIVWSSNFGASSVTSASASRASGPLDWPPTLTPPSANASRMALK